MKIKVESERIVKAVKKVDGIEILVENVDDAKEALNLILRKHGLFQRDDYDQIKYRDLILDAAETILRTFDFTRQQFGTRSKKSSFTWEI